MCKNNEKATQAKRINKDKETKKDKGKDKDTWAFYRILSFKMDIIYQ